MIEIELTPDEIHLAASHGIQRRLPKLRGERDDRVQKEASSWDNEIQGCCAELAWCKLTNTYWSGVGGLRARDAHTVEVRWTHHQGRGGLIVYPGDSEDRVYVLMEGYAPVMRVVGWLQGAEAKRLVANREGLPIVDRRFLRPYDTHHRRAKKACP